MALRKEMLNKEEKEAPDANRYKHFNRKHGEGAYYGQNEAG